MGHTNNSRFLTFCESARIDYWEAATGEPFALVTHGAEESLILAEIRVTFRSPSYFGEPLVVESGSAASGGRRSRWSTGSRPRASDRGAAPARRHRRGRAGPLRLRRGAPAGRSPTRSSRASRRSRGGASAA